MASSGENKLFPNQRGFPTPNTAPDEIACRVLSIPAQEDWLSVFMGALEALTHEWAWWQNGDLLPSEAAAAARDIIDQAYAQAEIGICETSVETPFWDTDSDVGAEEPSGSQTWYGAVEDVLAPPDGITFSENLQIWTFAGLLAIAGAPGAAISFITIAPKFVIAIKGRDVGEVIRIIVDAQDVASVDTSGHAGEVINTSIVADPANDTHQIYLIKTT